MTAPGGEGWPKHIRRTLALLLIVVSIVLIITSSAFELIRAWIDRADQIVAQNNLLSVAIFLVLSALSAMLAFFSTMVIIPVAVGAWGKLLTFILLWTGWLIGGIAAYAIGRYLGRPAVRWFVAEKRLKEVEARVDSSLSLPRLLLLQTALPSEVPAYILGTLRYPLRTYLYALMIVELPFAAGAVFIGDRFLQRDYILLSTIAVAGLLVTFIAGWFVYRGGPPRTTVR